MVLFIPDIVDYSRCRIYRQFIQSLINDRSICTGGSSGLFDFTVLCNYANFRTSYRRIDGIGYTIYPGEWICTVKELSVWFRTHFQRQAMDILDELQRRHLISYLILDRGKVIKYKIRGWKNHNTVLDYNCPCQKDTGFFFMPVVAPQREMICDIQKNYHLPWKARTVGEMIAVARQESGARKLERHDIMALERFDPEVTHMIVFDVLSRESHIGDKGERMRLPRLFRIV